MNDLQGVPAELRQQIEQVQNMLQRTNQGSSSPQYDLAVAHAPQGMHNSHYDFAFTREQQQMQLLSIIAQTRPEFGLACFAVQMGFKGFEVEETVERRTMLHTDNTRTVKRMRFI